MEGERRLVVIRGEFLLIRRGDARLPGRHKETRACRVANWPMLRIPIWHEGNPHPLVIAFLKP